MEGTTENPSRAAEYLKELNNIIEAQQELLERQKGRIGELERRVDDLSEENARLKEEQRRHLATCRHLVACRHLAACRLLEPGDGQHALGSISEHAGQEK